MNIQPLGNRVLIKRHFIEETKKGSLIILETSQKKQEIAKIIALGEGKRDANGNLMPFPFAVGDSVIVEKYVGTEFMDGDETYQVVNADSIIAKLS